MRVKKMFKTLLHQTVQHIPILHTIELVYGISAILQFTAQYFCIKCSSGKESCIASSLNLFRLDHPPGAHRGTSCQDL